MTLVASSIVAWCRYVGADVAVAVAVEVEVEVEVEVGAEVKAKAKAKAKVEVDGVEEEEGGLGRKASRFHVARPAVEFSFLLHTNLTPPVEAASADTWPEVMVSSNSLRNSSASACFEVSKAFLRAIASLSFFAGVLVGLLVFEGEVDGETLFSDSSLSGKSCRRTGDLRGEYVSFQSLISEALQKASREGRWGERGMRAWGVLEGDWRRGFEGEVGGVVISGGVRGRVVVAGLWGEEVVLRGERERGGELEGCEWCCSGLVKGRRRTYNLRQASGSSGNSSCGSCLEACFWGR